MAPTLISKKIQDLITNSNFPISCI